MKLTGADELVRDMVRPLNAEEARWLTTVDRGAVGGGGGRRWRSAGWDRRCNGDGQSVA